VTSGDLHVLLKCSTCIGAVHLEKAQRDLIHVHKYPKGDAKRTQPGSLQQCPVPGAEAVCTTEHSSSLCPSGSTAVLSSCRVLAQAALRLWGLLLGAAYGPGPCSGWLCWGRGTLRCLQPCCDFTV